MDKDWNSILSDKQKLRLYTRTAFDRVDKDKSGFLELKELKIVLCALAEELGTQYPSNEDVFNVMNKLDKNGDKKIDIVEFELLAEKIIRLFVQKQ